MDYKKKYLKYKLKYLNAKKLYSNVFHLEKESDQITILLYINDKIVPRFLFTRRYYT